MCDVSVPDELDQLYQFYRVSGGGQDFYQMNRSIKIPALED